MYASQSLTTFSGTCNLTDNLANTGGAVYATESVLSVYNEMMVVFNMAKEAFISISPV